MTALTVLTAPTAQLGQHPGGGELRQRHPFGRHVGREPPGDGQRLGAKLGFGDALVAPPRPARLPASGAAPGL